MRETRKGDYLKPILENILNTTSLGDRRKMHKNPDNKS